MPRLRLRPFERSQLPLAEPWFTDADTQAWLGGPRWPREMLDLADEPLGEFRGAVETGRYHWLAWEHDTAVGYIDCGTCDRWTTWDGGRVTSTINLPSGNMCYVVDPALRRRGYGTTMITAVMAMPELAQIPLLTAGVEPANAASVGCLVKAGFQPLDPEPDFEGVVYYAWFRSSRDPAG
jgi:RimJ/RimL family protein N-acetyltransferase